MSDEDEGRNRDGVGDTDSSQPSRFRKILLALLVSVVTLVVALLGGEFALRLAVDKVDYLQPTIAHDTILGRHIRPGSAGYDAWGFRNVAVPAHADVVAIGDSQTFGWTAPADQSWPAWLQSQSNLSVYNLALGGYGPLQYRYLFHHYALQLHPQTVVFGLYLGNDIADAYNFARKRERLSDRAAKTGKRGSESSSQRHVSVPLPNRRFLGGLRGWLSSHSVLFQVLKYRLPSLVGFLRFHEAKSVEGSKAVVLHDPVAVTMFTPDHDLEPLDLSDPRIRIGLDTTKEVFAGLAADCARRRLRCLVLLIPTKESVYSDVASRRLSGSSLHRVQRVVQAETQVRDELEASFREHDLPYVDPLPSLRRAVLQEKIYPTNQGSHPHGPGYRVLATVVDRALRGPKASSTVRRNQKATSSQKPASTS